MRNSFSKKLKRAAAFSMAIAQIAAVGIAVPSVTANAQASSAITRNMENLDRGVVAMKVSQGTYISWRRLATEPASTNFELYRNQEKIAEGPITNYSDPDGQLGDSYTVVCNGTMSEPFAVLEDNYIEIPMAQTPESDVMATDRNGVYYGAYTPGDGTYGDLDGDGQYELIVLWCPPDAKDAASGGRTGKAYIDAYRLDGTFMWRIDMGYNIRAGAHDTMLCVADFDGDGRAELMVRTSDGTVDGQGNVIGDKSKGETYENSWAALNGGKNLQGPIYMTCFDGETGKALDTVDYYPQNSIGSMETSLSFGDDFGNRSERYNATIAFLDGQHPSVVVGRGYYFGKNGRQRQAAAAYNFSNGKLSVLWKFDTEPGSDGYKSGNEKYVGQGNHQMEAADADGDGKDEVTTGAMWYDDDGTILWSSQLEHGDVIHVGDFTPENPGLEIMTAKEDYSDSAEHFDYSSDELANKDWEEAIGTDLEFHRQKWGIVLQDVKTGKAIQVYNGTKDTGRGVIANIGYGDSYYVMWGAGGTGYHDNKGTDLGNLGLSMNGRIYWDGDLQDELQDHKGAGKEIVISKWNDTTKKNEEIFVPEGTHSINSTKGNTCGQGDIIGDWREEFVSYVIKDQKDETFKTTVKGSFDKDVEVEVNKTTYQYALRLYTTNIPTEYNFYTLAHDDVYRNSSSTYNNCYNQPPHISWYMNDKIENSPYTTQPDANVKLVRNKYSAPAFDASKLPAAGERKPAASNPTTPTAPSSISVKLNGKALDFDVAPQIINDRTMVPMRKIFESMGAAVDWNQDTRTVTSTKGDKTITMTIDNPEMKVNDDTVALDSAPTIVDDRTLVPVRAIAEAFGSKVDWDGDTKTVTITDEDVAAGESAPTPAPTVSFKGYDFAPEVPAYSAIAGVTVLSEGMTGYNTFTGVYKNDLQPYIEYVSTISKAGFEKKVNGKTTTYTKDGIVVVVTEGDNNVTVSVTK